MQFRFCAVCLNDYDQKLFYGLSRKNIAIIIFFFRFEPLKMTAIDVEALSARRDLQGRPMRGIRKEIYHQTRQFCEDFEEKHLNPAIDSLLKEFNRHLNIHVNDGEPAPAGVTICSFFSLK